MTDDPDHSSHPGPSKGGPGPAPLGSVLAAAREARGLSVEDVAARTRIRSSLVHAIERDDFSGCGGAFYARAHIRAIAKVVDADGDALVREFDRRQGEGRATSDPLGPVAPFPRSPGVTTRRPTPRWTGAAIVVVLAIVAILIGRWASGGGSTPSRAPKAAGTTASPATHSPHPTHTSSPAPTTQPPTTTPPTTPPATTTPPPTAPGVAVVVQVTAETSWIEVISSEGRQVYQGILEAGSQMRFTDRSLLTVRFGNARVVTVSVNGSPGATPCGQTVCTVQFTRSSTTSG